MAVRIMSRHRIVAWAVAIGLSAIAFLGVHAEHVLAVPSHDH